MRLSELHPLYQHPPDDLSPGRLSFRCPKCQLGIVSVWLVAGSPNLALGAHGCNKLPVDIETLTVTPSIADEGNCRRCPGWHGHITNGEVE